MSITLKRVLICIISLIAAIFVWPFMELILYYQNFFKTYLIFSIVQGAIIGFVLGIFFGITEGILVKKRFFILKGMLVGGTIGLLGGGLGGFIGQLALIYIGTSNVFHFIARGIGFGFLGIFIGMSEGIRAKSLQKILVGILGGFLGGFIGGYLIEKIIYEYPDVSFTRLIGVTVFSLLIGLFYGLIEKKLSHGKLTVLNGELKKKEFNINQNIVRIGSSENCDITLKGDSEIINNHAEIYYQKGKLKIRKVNDSNMTIVNDEEICEHTLKFEDVIQIGSTKLFYRCD